jgi:hypothetical protein
MFPYDPLHFVYVVALSLALLGLVCTATGVLLLVTRASGRSVQTIANQAARLGQKGLSEDIAGLVGNASSLVDALNQLVRTSAGIGIFLVVFGFIMLVAAYLMIKLF